MSYSKVITEEDLTNILNKVVPPATLNPWVSISATGFTGNNTATKVTGTTIRSGGNASDYFDTSVSNQVTIKRAGTYKITIFFRITAITSAGNVKRISCYNNGSEFCVAMSRTNSWEDVQSTTIAGCSVGDVLTMYRRAEDGNSTYAPALILIEAINSTTGNISAEADYIVEQGTIGDTHYRKWNSGTAEMWIHTTQSVALNSVDGSLYQGTWNWTFPFAFTAVPTCQCSMFKWGTGASWGTIAGVSTTLATLRGIDVVSRASGSTEIHAYAIGTWK